MAGLAVAGAGAPVQAQLLLDLPDLVLQPNQSGQSFTLTIQNLGPELEVVGVQLDFMIGDPPIGSSGAPAFAGGGVTGRGLLFGDNNNGEGGVGNEYAPGEFYPQLYQAKTATASGSVALGIGTFDLATLEFDTTGVTPGTYTWTAGENLNGPSFFILAGSQEAYIPIHVNGILTVVPEPHECAILAAAGLLGFGVWRRKGAGRSAG